MWRNARCLRNYFRLRTLWNTRRLNRELSCLIHESPCVVYHKPRALISRLHVLFREVLAEVALSSLGLNSIQGKKDRSCARARRRARKPSASADSGSENGGTVAAQAPRVSQVENRPNHRRITDCPRYTLCNHFVSRMPCETLVYEACSRNTTHSVP